VDINRVAPSPCIHPTVVDARWVVVLFSNDSFSIAASIIRFPLMIEVVQMTMFLRAARMT
jgi:hypothetical protein